MFDQIVMCKNENQYIIYTIYNISVKLNLSCVNLYNITYGFSYVHKLFFVYHNTTHHRMISTQTSEYTKYCVTARLVYAPYPNMRWFQSWLKNAYSLVTLYTIVCAFRPWVSLCWSVTWQRRLLWVSYPPENVFHTFSVTRLVFVLIIQNIFGTQYGYCQVWLIWNWFQIYLKLNLSVFKLYVISNIKR